VEEPLAGWRREALADRSKRPKSSPWQVSAEVEAHGWPENWYAWRLLMPALARDFEVIAVDQRGIGLTDKPKDGYDTGTLASDLVALMDALGHERFAVVGHDTGLIISYALAADHPHRVDRVALAEVPGPRGWFPHRPCSSPSRSTTGFGTSPSTGSTTS
jgi:pimeloyl-ACP methyl ester carboxylesterase